MWLLLLLLAGGGSGEEHGWREGRREEVGGREGRNKDTGVREERGLLRRVLLPKHRRELQLPGQGTARGAHLRYLQLLFNLPFIYKIPLASICSFF